MSKKSKCEHENKPVSMSGCVSCVTTAMTALNLMRWLKCTPHELLTVVRDAFPNQAAFDTALASAREKINKEARDE